MEHADDSFVSDEFFSELIDITALDVEQVLAAERTPLAVCLRRLIQQNSRTASAVAGFENFLGEDEPTDAV